MFISELQIRLNKRIWYQVIHCVIHIHNFTKHVHFYICTLLKIFGSSLVPQSSGPFGINTRWNEVSPASTHVHHSVVRSRNSQLWSLYLINCV